MPSQWCAVRIKVAGINIADMILLIWCSDAAGTMSEAAAGAGADADADVCMPYNDL